MPGQATCNAIYAQRRGPDLIRICRSLALSGLVFVAVLLTIPLMVLAVDDVQVMGLYRGMAVLWIDGKRRVLARGERSPEGVTLIDSTSDRAILEIQGQRSTHVLGSRVTTAFAKRRTKRVSIYRDPQGTYTTVGSINGIPVNFLVDTGATAIAMGAEQARRLGVDFRLEGRKIGIRTAAGRANAFEVKLTTVKVGDIEQKNVVAYIIEGDAPKTVLLGMSYLNRLKISNEGHVMHLEQKY